MGNTAMQKGMDDATSSCGSDGARLTGKDVAADSGGTEELTEKADGTRSVGRDDARMPAVESDDLKGRGAASIASDDGDLVESLAKTTISESETPSIAPPRLPVEILALIAEALVDEGLLKTAAKLNQTSRGVHTATLLPLYETLTLYDAEALKRSLGESDPRSWSKVKYLHLDGNTDEVLTEYLYRHEELDHLITVTEFHQKLQQTFPSLVLVFVKGTIDRRISDYPTTSVTVTLYRSVSLDTVLERCIVDTRSSRVSLFGVRFNGYGAEKPSTTGQSLDIDTLQLREGISLSPSLSGIPVDVATQGVSILDPHSWSRYGVEVYDEQASPDIAQAFDLLASCANFGNQPEDTRLPFEVNCQFGVTLAGFGMLIEWIKARRLSETPQMHILLINCDHFTQSDMETHLDTLVQAFASNWDHFPLGFDEEFAEIKAKIPPPPAMKGIPSAHGIFKGVLKWGNTSMDRAERTRENIEAFASGFTSELSVGHEYPGGNIMYGNFRQVWTRYHRCEHVPFVFEMPEELSEGEGDLSDASDEPLAVEIDAELGERSA